MLKKKNNSDTNSNNQSLELVVDNIYEKNKSIGIENETDEKKRRDWVNQFKENEILLLDNEEFKLHKIIGKGSYGNVWKVSCKDKYYALKIITCNEIKGEQIHIQLSKNIDIIKGINLHCLNTPEEIPLTHGFLMDLGFSVRKPSFKECFFILINICKNLSDLNKYNITHNDIKPDNIVRTIDGRYSLIDFSLSCTKHLIEDNNLIQTRWYRPLEVLTNQPDIDYLKSDIWALGCTIYELYCNKAIFPADCEKTQIELINKFYSLNPNEQYSLLYNDLFVLQGDFVSYNNKRNFIELILLMLTKVNERPNATMLLPIIENTLIKIE